ncbi:MAG: secondary thiamine-phosphate synthase enzyme YjbQ [Opitutales bacterium]|nr:secondary thiamine-phosphate synthase enzyme YjbQ [Opitutales bacterium]
MKTMICQNTTITVSTKGQGTYEITPEVESFLQNSGLQEGQLTVFCQHTSCSLVIMENADPSARVDLEAFLNRLVPENQKEFTHTMEGPDDMPSHIKMALTRSAECVPVTGGQAVLGTWQGIFLWEHRRSSHRRRIVLSAVGTG